MGAIKMGITYSLFFPPTPTLTEDNLLSQQGRVFIVTGGTSGIGFELCRILYHAQGTVYLTGRSEESARASNSRIEALSTAARGKLDFLEISLDDLSTIKPAVTRFLEKEDRLDVLFNNAGVSNPPVGSVSPQGHELQLATNCLGPYLFTQLLLPTLISTANKSPTGSVRVVWTGSIVVDLSAPTSGIDISDLSHPPKDQQKNYTTSKTGNWFLADDLARQAGSDGVLSICQNPGNLKSLLTRHMPRIVPLLVSPLLYHAKFGAYTELWSGLSPELTMEDGGKFVLPWGRLHPNSREDLLTAIKSKEEGGTGVAEEFLWFCKRETGAFK
ncbi:putative secondary metabolism biosynthetic enzyme [Paraconiothyrium brasiliense]|uniref:Secondary metabolism biosynthetic enzyme n=1 Tax=Paraconiothyrium brasiliense TaxID=300254 RepID=A0ABR3RJY8_9PLEO